MRVAFTEREYETKWRGYNPEFYRRARQKAAREAAEKARQEREELRRQQAEARKKEKEAIETDTVTLLDQYRERVVRGFSTPDGKRPARLIIAEVAAQYGFTYDDIVGVSRMKELIVARHTAMRVVADERPDMTLPQLGRIFNRDHTSVLSALRKTRQPGRPR